MPNEYVEELRLALVMNGGVSLAVWMGGVTNEIHRLVTQRHPVYAGLLDMTRTTARVDVISGTSAGGINGAALGLSLVYGSDFSVLRNVWMIMGSFDELLRPPMGSNPGSLLRGNDYFLPQITAAFTQLAAAQSSGSNGAAKAPYTTPLDLRLTTTLLKGRPAFTVDDLGTRVGDIDHRARFRFQYMTGNESTTGKEIDDFEDRALLVKRLSLAARSTASFPFAFEPSTLPASTDEKFAVPLVDVDDMRLKLPRYVVDGGVLDNKPFRGAIQSIFAMKAERGVRRVLAYINPDPGFLPTTDDPFDPPVPGAAGHHGGAELPGLAPVVAASLFGIPQSQTIADQLEEIQSHNHNVRMRRDSVLDMARLARTSNLMEIAINLFPLYRKRRIAFTFENFVYSVLPVAAANNSALEDSLRIQGKHSRNALRLSFEKHPWTGWIPDKCQLAPGNAEISNSATWEWGLSPVDFGAKTLLNVLRITQRLKDSLALRKIDTSNSTTQERVASQGRAGTCDPCDWADPDYVGPVAGQRIAIPDVPGEDLTEISRQAFTIVDDIAKLRTQEERIWIDKAAELLQWLSPKPGSDSTDSFANAVNSIDWDAMFLFVNDATRRQECGAFSYRIADALILLRPVTERVIQDALAFASLNVSDKGQADGLQCLMEFPFPVVQDEAASDLPARIVSRLLQLEVIEYALSDRDSLSEDALIELVQISGNSTSPIGGMQQAKDKLLGLALAHFAAFYKESWRANDWLYGRLDGSERLVKVLLNPDRLQRVFSNSAAAVAAIHNIAVTSVPSDCLKEILETSWKGSYAGAVASELAFLDKAGSMPPDELPNCANAIALRLHYGILREELPNLRNAILDDQAAGADADGPGAALLNKLAGSNQTGVCSPEEARQALVGGLLGAERLADEAGSDLFTRVMAHTLAALQNTLASKHAKLGPVSALVASLRVPVIGFYFVARGLTHQSRTSAALNGAILAVGALIVAMQFLWTDAQSAGSVAHAIVTMGWVLFAYGMLMSTLRLPGTTCVSAVVLAVVVGAAGIVFGRPVLLAPFVLLVLLYLSVRWVWLQFAMGLAVIIFAGFWAGGELAGALPWATTPVHDGTSWELSAPAVLSMIVVAAILLATWQMSPCSKKVEAWIRRILMPRRAAAHSP